MTNQAKPLLILLLCFIQVASPAQKGRSATLELGDPAPPIQAREWIKGSPVRKIEKGRVYVLEFWATWCGPCIRAMPHLSALAREYKDKVTIIGIDILEKKTTPFRKVKAFVDSMGQQMDYVVATDNQNFMVANWMTAAGLQVIPTTFVVNASGQVAWIGHPNDLAEVLAAIVNNTWDIKGALTKKNADQRLEKLDWKANNALSKFTGDSFQHDYIGKPDSALMAIQKIVSKEPGLRYAPCVATHTFSSLLRTDMHKAYAYGKMVLVTRTYERPAYDAIISGVDFYSDKLHLSPEIYALGAEAYQMKIDGISNPELHFMYRFYNVMAQWYWRAHDKGKAIETQKKGIAELKSKNNFSVADLAELESDLSRYLNN